MLCFHAQRQGSLPGPLRGATVSEVVFHATDQQCEPACGDKNLAVLGEGHLGAEQARDPMQPGAPLDEQLLRWQMGVIGAQLVGGYPKGIERWLVNRGRAEPRDDVQGAQASYFDELRRVGRGSSGPSPARSPPQQY